MYVEGAQRGDLLEVTIEKIVVDDQGFTAFRPGRSPLGDSYRWRSLRGPYVHIVEHRPGPSGTTRDGKGVLNDKVTWDLQPMIGTIGVAPDREVETSAVGQGPWGGVRLRPGQGEVDGRFPYLDLGGPELRPRDHTATELAGQGLDSRFR